MLRPARHIGCVGLLVAVCVASLATYAGNDSYAFANSGACMTLYVLGNDVERTVLSFVESCTQSTGGSVKWKTASGCYFPYVEYTPPPNYYGTITFYYTAQSGSLNPTHWTYLVTIQLTRPSLPSEGGGGGPRPRPAL